MPLGGPLAPVCRSSTSARLRFTAGATKGSAASTCLALWKRARGRAWNTRPRNLRPKSCCSTSQKLDVRIIRPFNVAGPRQSPNGGFVLPRFVQQALTGQPVTVYAPGTQRRALTHVLDIVDGIWLAWRKGTPNRDYNLGNPANTCSMTQLAHEVVYVCGQGDVVVVDPVGLHGDGFREAAEKFPDAHRAATELGWSPTRSRADIIRDTVEWSR
jgi:nucleoside-diphosphate-sugar epimerase